MTAVLAWARLDLRRRWRSFAVLVLLVAFAGAVVLATLAGARRTDTAEPRFLAKAPSPDVMALPNDPTFDWDKVRNLPSVAALSTFVLTDGPNALATVANGQSISVDDTMGFSPGDAQLNQHVDRPYLFSGHLPDENDPTQALATPDFVKQYGRTITLHLPSAAQTKDADIISDTAPDGFTPMSASTPSGSARSARPSNPTSPTTATT